MGVAAVVESAVGRAGIGEWWQPSEAGVKVPEENGAHGAKVGWGNAA